MSVHHSHAETPGASATFPYPTRFAELHAGTAFFDSGGPATSGGETLLCVHGLGANFTHFEHVAPPLAERHRVVGLDLPGCGESAQLAVSERFRYSLRLYAETAVRLLDHLGIERAVWVGHSLGGGVTVEAALLHPDRVRGLVLIDSAGFHRYSRVVRFLGPRLLTPGLVSPLMERLAFRLLDQVFQDRNEYTEKFLADTRGKPHHPTVDEFAITACSLLPDLVGRHFLDRVEAIGQPTLVLWGDRDKLLSLAEAQVWSRRLPRGRLVVFRGCGHMPIVERPRQTVAAIEEFLERDLARGGASRFGLGR